MNCKEAKKQISLFIDGKLSSRELSVFKKHLSGCGNCVKALKETQQAVGLVSGAPRQVLPEGFHERLNRRLNKETFKETESKPLFGRVQVYRGLATTCVLVLIMVLFSDLEESTRRIQQSVIQPTVRKRLKEERRAPLVAALKDSREDKRSRYMIEYESAVKLADKSSDSMRIAEEAVPVKAIRKAKEKARITVNYKKKRMLPGIPVKREMSALSEMPHFKLKQTETREWIGSYSGYGDSGEMVFTDMDSWELFWQNHADIQEPQPPLPVIDFNADMIVAVFKGQKPTGGYSIKIVGIERTKKEITVKYTERTPAPGAMLTQALTQPYHIKVIEKSALPVVFRKIQ